MASLSDIAGESCFAIMPVDIRGSRQDVGPSNVHKKTNDGAELLEAVLKRRKLSCCKSPRMFCMQL